MMSTKMVVLIGNCTSRKDRQTAGRISEHGEIRYREVMGNH